MANAQLFLFDGHALCYRSFFAIKELATSKGQPTNAVYGFVRTICSILRDYRPDYAAVCFDSPGKTRRQERFAAYKIQRPVMPDALQSQIPIVKEVTKAFHVAVFELSGYEADDIIATIFKNSEGEKLDVVIVSDDKDMFQLAGDNVKFFNSKSGAILSSEELKKKIGFEPSRITDYIGLAGDGSDNIPGVRGIGAVSAKNLINKLGSLEEVIRHLKQAKRPSPREQLIIDQEAAAILSKELAILETAAPISFDLTALRVREPDRDRLFTIFQDLEFRKLAEEFAPKEKGEELEVSRVEKLDDAGALVDLIQDRGQFVFTVADGSAVEPEEKRVLWLVLENEKIYEVRPEAIAGLKAVFENGHILKITYDVKEKLKILASHGVFLDDKVFDVMLAGYLLGSSSGSFTIDALAWNYYQGTLGGRQKTASQLRALERLYLLLTKELNSKALMPLFENIETPLAYVLYKMESAGVNLDLALLEDLSKSCAQKIDELTATLYELSEGPFNLNSPKQLSRILFEKLKLPVIKKTKTGFSTDESVLTVLAQKHVFPSLILEYRQLAKLKSTYIDALPKLISPRTGRLHAQFNQTGTETGRLSSSQPNLQNIPVRTELGRQIRKAIIPSKSDWVLLAADYSQIELRILAHLSGDDNLIRAFRTGEDIHAYTASLVFDIDESIVTPEMRNAAKRVNFGIIYGMSAFGLAGDLRVPQSEAQAFIDRYFLRYPAVKGFMDGEIKKCEQNGYVCTLLNRRRYIPEINSANGAMRQFAQRQAVNTPVQGSAADLMKLAMINIQRAVDKTGLEVRMISTVHDELVFEGPLSEMEELAKLVRYQMESAVVLKVPVLVSVKIGNNWLEMKEV